VLRLTPPAWRVIEQREVSPLSSNQWLVRFCRL